MEWKEVLLSEFLEFNPKRTIKKNEVARKITMDLLIPHSKQIYSFKYEPYTGGAKFSNGDTIMARITPCLENGKHAYVSCLNEGEIAYGSTEYIVLCGKNGVSDNEFVYYLSHTPQFVNTAIKSMVGSSGRQRAQVPVLENLIMPVPVNLSDQRKIAGILSALDAKIENNNKINANLEAQAQALFKSWFVDFTPFKDQPFVDSELGPIPQGWKVGKLGDYCECVLGGTPSRSESSYWNGDIAWINSGEVNKFRICTPSEFITSKGLDNSSTKLLPKKTTVLAITGATLGQISILEIDSCANQSVIGIKQNDNMPYEFIYPTVKVNIKRLLNLQTGGAQQHINKNNVQNLFIVYPPKFILQKYKEHTKCIYSKISTLCFENQRLAALRDTLLPKLMSGEIKL